MEPALNAAQMTQEVGKARAMIFVKAAWKACTNGVMGR